MRATIFLPASSLDCLHLGRLDYSTLPQQALMELLVHSLPDRDAFEDENDHFSDITEWEGVTCEDGQRVVAIRWGARMFIGTLDLQWLPRTLRTFDVASNAFSGSVQCRLLPLALRHFVLTDNGFMGSVDLTRLPPALVSFVLTDNVFSGTLNLSKLPTALQNLGLSRNEFSGILDLSKVGRPMATIEFGADPETDFAEGDEALSVDFSENDFEGDVIARELSDFRGFGMFGALRCKQIVDKRGNARDLGRDWRM